MSLRPARWLIPIALPLTATAQISVGANVQVSKPYSTASHYELLANADPRDPNRLIACSYISRKDNTGRDETVVYSSFDGGKTWETTLEPKRLGGSGDPVCAYGLNGEAYYSMLKDHTWLFTSRDGGRTWLDSVALPVIDRQSIIVDTSSTSKFRGSVYINGTGSTRGVDAGQGDPSSEAWRTDLTVFFSRDGKNFNTSKRAQLGSHYTLGMGNGAVFSDGSSIYVFGHILNANGRDPIARPTREKTNALLRTITSPDGGVTLNAAVTVSDFFMDWPPTASAVIPYIVTDGTSGPFRDRAYVVWPDMRSGRGEIYIAYSDDKGKTWSRPVIVNDDAPYTDGSRGPDHVLPVIGVNRDGVVGVSWQDRREHRDNLGWYTRFSASLDGGDTWLPSVKVSEKPQSSGPTDDLPLSASGYGTKTGLNVSVGIHPFAFSGGHYAGLAVSADGKFHPAWVDNRTGTMQIWMAPVTVTGRAVKNGNAELSSLVDVSEKLSLELSDTRLDRRAGTLTLTAVMVNKSKDTIRGPVKARVTRIGSQLATAKVVGATNGHTGIGALYDFSSMLTNGVLLPDGKSSPRTLTFSVTGLKPYRSGDDIRTRVLELEARVFAQSVSKGTPATEAPR